MTDDKEYQKTMAEAALIADAIEDACHEKQSVAAFLAIGIVIGRFCAQAGKPDFHGTTRLINEAAFDTFRQSMRERRNG